MSFFLGSVKSKPLKTDLSPYLKKDGSVAMTGNLNLGGYIVNNLKTYPEQNSDATSKKYVDDETSSLLDLAANRQMSGDLDMGDNAIIGIEDINASNSVVSKKYVDDSVYKNKSDILINKNAITLLKSKKLYSHYFHFNYQNPVASLAKNPSYIPLGFPDLPYIFSPDYGDKTKITLIALMIDSDTIVNNNSATLVIDIKLYDNTGGSAYKTLMPSKNIGKYRKNSNLFRFDDLSFVIKDLDSANYDDWNGFILPITVSWSNNETTLYFSVDY